jgi:hypothetical protein
MPYRYSLAQLLTVVLIAALMLALVTTNYRHIHQIQVLQGALNDSRDHLQVVEYARAHLYIANHEPDITDNTICQRMLRHELAQRCFITGNSRHLSTMLCRLLGTRKCGCSRATSCTPPLQMCPTIGSKLLMSFSATQLPLALATDGRAPPFLAIKKTDNQEGTNAYRSIDLVAAN